MTKSFCLSGCMEDEQKWCFFSIMIRFMYDGAVYISTVLQMQHHIIIYILHILSLFIHSCSIFLYITWECYYPSFFSYLPPSPYDMGRSTTKKYAIIVRVSMSLLISLQTLTSTCTGTSLSLFTSHLSWLSRFVRFVIFFCTKFSFSLHLNKVLIANCQTCNDVLYLSLFLLKTNDSVWNWNEKYFKWK